MLTQVLSPVSSLTPILKDLADLLTFFNYRITL
jgi:hypothetical protein